MLAGACMETALRKPEKRKNLFLVQSLAASFKQEFGTLYCRELLGLSRNAWLRRRRPGEEPPPITPPAPVNAALPSAPATGPSWKQSPASLKCPVTHGGKLAF